MISKEYAMCNRLLTYDDCRPCYRNHPPQRYTKTGKCVYCHREKAKLNKMSPKQLKAHRLGLVELEVLIHHDDVETFKAFCKALRIDRNIPNEFDS